MGRGRATQKSYTIKKGFMAKEKKGPNGQGGRAGDGLGSVGS